jgi:prophage maintenance system killer protein
MPEPQWLDRDLVDALHEQSLRVHGGLAGVRDVHVLEAAIASARNPGPTRGKRICSALLPICW